MIKVAFHGAARTVTGSRHIITVNSQNILLDCGLFQGKRAETYQKNLNFSFNPAEIDAVILSHAHIDHIGNVPNLVKQGFNGDIHATLATVDLSSIMLNDSARIQESDVKFVNKINKRKNQPPVEPLYSSEDVPPTLELTIGHNYNRPFRVGKSVQALFRDAGHILGSAITVLDIDDEGRRLSLCYTGDLGRKNMPIIRDPYDVKDGDVLIIESTYGNRLHENIINLKDNLAAVINETAAVGGKILIPSFALERAQEIIYTLHQLKLEHKIADLPVYVDSPLAIDATDIFRLHPECFDREMNEFMMKVDDPFGFHRIHYTRSTEESIALNHSKDPMIIIAGSGMAEGGRILHHLKYNIEDARTTVLIVGWQAENTLGRKIAEKWQKVPIFGEPYDLKARVEILDEFSAHADKNDLLDWVSKGKQKWSKVFIVHGEESASLSFADELKETGLPEVIVPKLEEVFEL